MHIWATNLGSRPDCDEPPTILCDSFRAGVNKTGHMCRMWHAMDTKWRANYI